MSLKNQWPEGSEVVSKFGDVRLVLRMEKLPKGTDIWILVRLDGKDELKCDYGHMRRVWRTKDQVFLQKLSLRPRR